LGVGLVYSVTPSETLDGNPTLVVSNHTTPAKILGFAYDSGKAAFTYTTSGGANEVDGLYDVSITMTDPVGNLGTVSNTTLPAVVKPVNLVVSQPTVSNVTTNRTKFSKVTNYQGTNYAGLSLTFDCPKDVKAGGTLRVKLDTVDMTSSCTYASGKYTCTYDVSTTGLSEGTKFITIYAVDSVGNSASGSASVDFDFTAPTAISTAPSKLFYKIGDSSVDYTVKTSEPMMGGGYPEVKVYYLSSAISGFFTPVSIPQSNIYTFTRSPISSDPSGAYDVFINMVDSVGNQTLVSQGVGFDIENTLPDITANSVSPATAKNGTVVNVLFTVTKDLAYAPTVRLGAVTLNGCVESPAKTYTCTHTAATSEGDGVKQALVDLTDLAGNTKTAAIGSVTYDVTPPSLVSSTILRSPTYTPYNNGDNNFYFNDKDPVTEGTVTATLYVYANEDLSASKTLTVIGPDALQFLEGGSSGNVAVFSYTINKWAPDGTYTFKLTWKDTIGNPSTVDLPVKLVKNSWGDTYRVDMTKVTYKRVPWGRLDPADQDTWIPAYLSVDGAANAIKTPLTVKGVYVYKGSSTNPGQPPSTGPGNLIGSTGTINTDGSFSIPQLTSGDLPVIHLAFADKYGVKGGTGLVQNIEWTASIGDKSPGSTFENPNILQTCGRPIPYLASDDSTCYEPTQTEIGNFTKSGPAAISRTTEGRWSQPPRYSTAPDSRSGAAMAYDSARGRVVLFGGKNLSADALNDTWEWDGYDWQKMSPKESPAPRWEPAMAYDSAKGRVVLFGGVSNAGAPEDTWEWDGTNWVKKATTGPTGRYGHAMTYDSARGRVIMLGGNGSYGGDSLTWEWDGSGWTSKWFSGQEQRENPGLAYDSARGKVVLFGGVRWGTSVFLQDTWEYDGTNWVQRAGPACTGTDCYVCGASDCPSAREYPSAAYDSGRGKTVIFGGRDNYDTSFNDTWEWNGSVWTKTSADGPEKRREHPLAYDVVRGRTVLFGGWGDSTPLLNDTWEWDGSDWVQKTSTVPIGRARYGLAHDSARGKTVLFGGYNGDTIPRVQNDTWEWGTTDWKQKSSGTPSGREGIRLSYDSARGRLVMFGGNLESGRASDTWEFDGTNWIQRAGSSCTGSECYICSSATCPSGRTNYSASYDSVRGKTVLFGGRPGTGLLNDTWEWDGSDWFQKTSTVPSGRARYGLAHDSARGKTVLFGGYNADTIPRVQNDTWEWVTTDWKQKSSGTPSGREGIRLSYDSARGRVVMFGGNLESGRANDTWEFDGTSWIQRAGSSCTGSECYICSSSTCPSGRTNYSASFDSVRGKTVLFGGRPGTGLLNDTWEWDGTVWVQRAGSSCTGTNCYTCGTSDCPGARDSHQTAYDMVRRKTVLFGGESGFLCDTWEWDGTVWVQRAGSSCTGTSCYVCGAATCPKGRHGHAMTFDTDRGTATVFGGFQSGMGYLNDTWEWNGTTWTERTPSAKPGARGDMQISYDSIRGKSLMFGGIVFGVNTPDTWEWDSGGARTPNAIFQASFYSAVLNMSYSIQSISAGFIGGGVGYPGGVTTGGVRLQPWMDYQWALLSDPSAQNTNDQNTPGPLSWTTTDAVAIRKSVFGPQKYISIAVVPVAIGGRGTGQVSLKDAEVTVKYKLCVYAGDCP
jgi:hypothetical protein